MPVRVTDFSITEEAFDPTLNPIRAKVSLGMRVLSVDDLGFQHKGGSLFMSYLQNKEQLAAQELPPAASLLLASEASHDRSHASISQKRNALKTPLFPSTSRYYGIGSATLQEPPRATPWSI